MEALIIKEGCKYKLRNGLTTEIVRKANTHTNYIFEAEVKEPEHKEPSIMCWLESGRCLTNSIEYKHDIVKTA